MTIKGSVLYNAGKREKVLLKEYYEGDYFRQFSLSNAIDQDKIEASFSNGVMKLVLPKVEKAQPRKIPVTAA